MSDVKAVAEVTREMVAAGEAVFRQRCGDALPESRAECEAAARAIYGAMERARPDQSPHGDAELVVRAAMLAVVASGIQRKLRPSEIVTALIADDAVSAALAPHGDAGGLREALEFERGYLIAVANLLNLHDAPVQAADVLGELSLNRNVLKKFDFSEYDLKPLRKAFRELERRSAGRARAALEKVSRT